MFFDLWITIRGMQEPQFATVAFECVAANRSRVNTALLSMDFNTYYLLYKLRTNDKAIAVAHTRTKDYFWFVFAWCTQVAQIRPLAAVVYNSERSKKSE